MGRKSIKEFRQQEIIKVFYQVAKKEGLENTSIAKIAAVMEINPSLIIHYFKTKEELTYALIDYILEKYLLIYKFDNRTKVDLEPVLVELIDRLFSKKWNKLFDDGLFYSCYALNFRDKRIKAMYKKLQDTLRQRLGALLENCKLQGVIAVDDSQLTADLIFVLIDGAYYYLSLVKDAEEYDRKISDYKRHALSLLNANRSTPLSGT
ncbi:TetR/AcrR family transcriptional regulator [Sphingobacterium alkalisoli]|uniref:Biofilm operon icaADBC HTH-type negative transcriptional regulator IcaR n=1 Tax=Sphingobacterium alkalisoli TaxID=1874115 RepID=A0A4V5LXY8_9SPHI|nr:TetR family transcriptional regulator [Sphingobacterium alkalisoli]TJY64479.1 TetR/AcrR family transcriptional regulator [Sphingobacterium alkalisoli]GGH21505.1 hypothetical protein GCM10011418_27420 [Sphingobacterium alkalisoli]